MADSVSLSSCSRVCVFLSVRRSIVFFFFFFNDTATTEIYTLSLHDALPISADSRDPMRQPELECVFGIGVLGRAARERRCRIDRKSTRLNSSHLVISYAVFCLKKKKIKQL